MSFIKYAGIVYLVIGLFLTGTSYGATGGGLNNSNRIIIGWKSPRSGFLGRGSWRFLGECKSIYRVV